MYKSSAKPANSQAQPMTRDCPGREVFHHITSRWAMLIVVSLQEGPQRFHALRDGLQGISEKMLSQTLKNLARDGFVLRLVDATVPPQMSYRLTPLGEALAHHFQGLVQWLGEHIEAILAVQRRHDQNQPIATAQHGAARSRNRP